MIRAVTFASAAATAGAAVLHQAPIGERIDGQYIVRLAAEHTGEELARHVADLAAKLGADFQPRRTYDALSNNGFPAFSCSLTPAGLNHLLKHGDYEYIEENRIINALDCVSESNPDWGLRRTNIRGSYTDGPYQYTTGASGAGIDAYIIDTGIYCANNEFVKKTSGTCVCGKDFVVDGGACTDGNGHGTHCGGTVAGITYGVAKEANLIAVRVLNDKGSGNLDDVVSGINWAAANAAGKPSVANLSLGSSYSQAVNDATESAVKSGLNMLVAAGNDNRNACNYSPASAALAVTVGATDIDDSRASYSNYGKCLDIFGPGTDITSAWIGSVNATKTISGTSMATPHVCGVAAKYLSADNTLTTSEVTAKLIADATQNVVTNANGGLFPNSDNTSPNLLAYGFCT